MLQIEIPVTPESWDEENEVFIAPTYQTLQLEHSLNSLSKWEARWCKPFFIRKEKTDEEVLDYIKCMTITPNVSTEVYNHLSSQNIEQINNYIEAPMTATTFSEQDIKKGGRQIVTAEIIYDWMMTLGIPLDCQNWHINRLIAMIKVRNIKSQPTKKKISAQERMNEYEALNEARKKKFNTKG